MCLCYLPQSWGWRSQLILSTEAPTGWPGKRAPPPLNAPYLASPHLPLVRRGRAGAKAQRGTTVRPRSGAEQSGSCGPILSTDSRPHPSPSEQLDYEGFLDTVGAARGPPSQAPLQVPRPPGLRASLTREPARGAVRLSVQGRYSGDFSELERPCLMPWGCSTPRVEIPNADIRRPRVESSGGCRRSPTRPLLHGPSPSPQGQLWPGGWMLSPAQFTRALAVSQAPGTPTHHREDAGLPSYRLRPQGKQDIPSAPNRPPAPRSTEGSPEVHRDRRTRRMLPGTREHLVSLGFVSMALLSFLPWR